jgi:peptidylprolyl isomerase
MRAVPRRLLPRLTGGLIAVALTAAGLTGCSTAGGGCAGAAASGPASDAIRVTGPAGAAPTVRFPTPSHVVATQATVIRQGTGEPIQPAQQIVANYVIMSGTTGKVVQPYTDKQAAPFVVASAIPSLRKALVCSRVGERLAALLPPAGSSTDSLVVVLDIKKAYLARADGVNQVMAGGLPAVVLAPDGRPGITVPNAAPPKQLVAADLKKGSGAVLKASDTAVVHYTGVLWKQRTVFGSSWKDGTPAAFALSGILKGLRTALVGQRVGSQVLAILPPSQGYGSTDRGTIPGDSTLVFVVDILGKA